MTSTEWIPDHYQLADNPRLWRNAVFAQPELAAEREGRSSRTRTRILHGADGTVYRLNAYMSQDQLEELCQRHHITRLSLFGSVLRDDLTPESDIDVLVEFEAGHVPGIFGMFDIQEELSALLGGRSVDLRTPHDLSRYFRDQVLAHAETQYVQP